MPPAPSATLSACLGTRSCHRPSSAAPPAPRAQATLRDAAGAWLARVDLYYAAARLALDYDGSTHRDTLGEDNRRQNRLLTAGYHLLRFTATDLYRTADHVITLTRAALRIKT